MSFGLQPPRRIERFYVDYLNSLKIVLNGLLFEKKKKQVEKIHFKDFYHVYNYLSYNFYIGNNKP